MRALTDPASVLESACRRALSTGRAFDLVEPESDSIRAALRAAIRWEDGEAEAVRTGAFSLGGLAGTAYRLGAPSSFRPRYVQIHCQVDGGVAVITWEDRLPAPGPAPLRVAPLRTALLVGIDDLATALVTPLRALGFHLVGAESGTVTVRERILDLNDRGVSVLDSTDVDAVVRGLRETGGAAIIFEGWSGDSVISPEGEVERAASDADATNRRLTEAVAAAFGSQVLLRDATTTPIGEPLGPIVAVCSALLAPLGDPVVVKESAEAALDLLLPTTRPYDEPNRHATDGPVVRISWDVERRLREHLRTHAPAVLTRLAPNCAPQGQHARPCALAVHQKFGPWTAHLLVEATLRARVLHAALSAKTYRRALERRGRVWVAEPGDALLNDPAIQNLLANRLGLIRWYWPMATIVPLTDRAVRVTCLVPTMTVSVPARLRWAVRAASFAGEALGEQLVAEALDEQTAMARFHATFGGCGHGIPRFKGKGRTADPIRAATDAQVSLTEEDGGLTLRSSPGRERDPGYWATLLERVHRKVIQGGRLVKVIDGEGEELARFLIGRHLPYTPDSDTFGRARAPFACGALVGVRVLLGSTRIPDARRTVQVISWRRDDSGERPAAVVFVPGREPGEPLVAAPLTAMLVLGFGNIAGDAASLPSAWASGSQLSTALQTSARAMRSSTASPATNSTRRWMLKVGGRRTRGSKAHTIAPACR